MGPIFSDATLNILTSKNNANIEVRFRDVFFIIIWFKFQSTGGDVEYLSASVSFQYNIYEFAQKGKVGTDIVTSFTFLVKL